MNTQAFKNILNFENIEDALIKYPKLLPYYYNDIQHDSTFLYKILDKKPHHCFKITNLKVNDLIYCIKKTIKNKNEHFYCSFYTNYLINNINFDNYTYQDRLILLNSFKNNKYVYKSLIERLNNYVNIEDLYTIYNIDIVYLEDLDIDNFFVLYLISIKKDEDLLKLKYLYLEFDIDHIKKIMNHNLSLLNNIIFYFNENYYKNDKDIEDARFKIREFIYENHFILKNIKLDNLKLLCNNDTNFLLLLLEQGYSYEQLINYNYENYDNKILEFLYLKNCVSVKLFLNDESKVLSYIDKYKLEVLQFLNKNVLTEKILKKLITINKDKVLTELLHKDIL